MISKMPIICNEISESVKYELNRHLHQLSSDHPFYREAENGIEIWTQDKYIIFRSSNGFYFRFMQKDIESEIWSDLHETRNYLCSAFEVDKEDPTVVDKLRIRFQEVHGIRYASMIEDYVIEYDNKKLMLVKFPSCVIRDMLESTGGLLKTGIRGRIKDLKQLPTLVKFNQVPTGDDDEIVYKMFVTEYKENMYLLAKQVHYDILREVISRPHGAVTLNPLAVWDS